MQMVSIRSRASSAFVARLNAEMDSRGINQDALADLLGISQGHLSKILSGKVRPGRRTSARVRELLDARSDAAPTSDSWLATVDEAARRSRAFKAVVDAALKLADTRNTWRKRRS